MGLNVKQYFTDQNKMSKLDKITDVVRINKIFYLYKIPMKQKILAQLLKDRNKLMSYAM